MSKKSSLDGFIPRRTAGQIGERRLPQPVDSGRKTIKVQHEGGLKRSRFHDVDEESGDITLTPSEHGLSNPEIEESLRGLDVDEPAKGSKPAKHRRRLPRKRIVKIVIALIILAILAVGGWMVVHALTASGNVFKGDILGLVQSKHLKADANGRSNILLLGTSEDDKGHDGAYLTDSMMMVSLSQTKKDVYMFSIPRDLYVKYGMGCNSGYQGKINEYFNCVNEDWSSKQAEEERLNSTKDFVGKIFGMDVQYAVHVNNSVIKNAVDAVGGVDVDIQGSNGDPGILDRNFDWRCGYKCNLVKYDNGVHHLDGEHALFLSMARGDVAPTYGLGNSNFDREKNQQKIIIALKEKAVSGGTLTNPAKVTSLIDAMGDNLRTTFDTSEIRTLVDFGQKLDTAKIKTLSLYEEGNQLVESGNVGGASVVVPVAGTFEYSAIRAYLNKTMNATPVTTEAAVVSVYNGSGIGGAAQVEADKIAELGMQVNNVANAPTAGYEKSALYKISSVKKPATAAKLESLYGVKLQTGAAPVEPAAGTDFVLIIGTSTAQSSGSKTSAN